MVLTIMWFNLVYELFTGIKVCVYVLMCIRVICALACTMSVASVLHVMHVCACGADLFYFLLLPLTAQ